MLQLQETSNRHASLLTNLADSLHVSYDRYPEAVEHARAIQVEAAAEFPSRIYNFVGDFLFSVGDSDLVSYAVRVADLEGVRRLALAAAELRSEGVAVDGVTRALARLAVTDPYTGTPFEWDGDAGTLIFKGLGLRNDGRYEIVY